VRPGLFGRALFPAAEKQVLVVPDSALLQRGQLLGVYVVHGDVALFRLVKRGKHYDKGVEILAGLDPGVRIISAPGAGVSDGVRIEEEKP
jgi:hypothetical protein